MIIQKQEQMLAAKSQARERESCTDHGCLLDDGVVGLLQVAVQDVAQHAGGVLIQVASPLGHPVVLAPYGHVDALLLQGQNRATCLVKVEVLLKMQRRLYRQGALTSSASVMMQPMTAQTRSVPSMSSLRREDLSWSMGTSQAPMAGVAVLSRFSCLQKRSFDEYLAFHCCSG